MTKKSDIRIMEKEKLLFLGLGKCGRCTLDQVKKYYSINYNRMQRLMKAGYLEKEPVVWQGENTYSYRLTSKGKDFTREHIEGIDFLYKLSKSGTDHDLQLFEDFSQLPVQVRRDTITEGRIVALYGQYSWTSPPDQLIPVYSRDGSKIVKYKPKEKITRFYTLEDKYEKLAFCYEILELDEEDIYEFGTQDLSLSEKQIKEFYDRYK